MINGDEKPGKTQFGKNQHSKRPCATKWGNNLHAGPGRTKWGEDQGSSEQSETNQSANFDAGLTIDKRYNVIGSIASQGGQAQLCICRDLHLQDEVVVKVYSPKMEPDHRVLEKLLRLQHKKVIAVRGYGKWEFPAPFGIRFYEVMEYARGGSLGDRLRKQPPIPFNEEELTKKVIPQIMEGFKICHANKIVHRDIKEANLFYRDVEMTDVVIGDFGVASPLFEDQSSRLTHTKGYTLKYLAPEAYPADGEKRYQVSASLDYFALGISLIELLGFDLFQSLPKEKFRIIKMRNEVPLPENISDSFATLLHGLLYPIPRSTDPKPNWTKRWGHPEVSSWLKGESVSLAAFTPTVQSIPAYTYKIDGISATSLRHLGELLLEHEKEAIDDMLHMKLDRGVDLFDTDVGRRIAAISERNTSKRSRYLEIVYTLNPSLPYRFAPGKEARSPEELASLIDNDPASWQAGIKQLNSGEILAWLTGIGQTQRVLAWQQKQGSLSSNDNAKMEVFLSLLNPKIASPKVRLSRSYVNVSGNEERPVKQEHITVTNIGRGHLHGSVTAGTMHGMITLETLTVEANSLLNKSTTIEFSVNTAQLERGRTYKSSIVLDTNAGKVKIPIMAKNAFPIWPFVRTCILSSLVGAVLAFVVRGLLNLKGKPDWLTNYYGHYVDFAEAQRIVPFDKFEFAFPLMALVGGVSLLIWLQRRR